MQVSAQCSFSAGRSRGEDDFGIWVTDRNDESSLSNDLSLVTIPITSERN